MKIFLVTDLHYSDLPMGEDRRNHPASAEKLRAALAAYTEGCDCVACLGDLTDPHTREKPQDVALAEISSILRTCPLPFFATFGNHDTAIDKRTFMAATGMPARYCAVDVADYRLLFLDSCMNSRTEPYPTCEIEWKSCYIDDEQRAWLRGELESATRPIVILTHVLLSAAGTGEINHVLKNADEITALLLLHEEKIAAVLCGHCHRGMHGTIGKIPYVVFRSLCTEDAMNCAVVELSNGTVTVTGYGDEPSIRFDR